MANNSTPWKKWLSLEEFHRRILSGKKIPTWTQVHIEKGDLYTVQYALVPLRGRLTLPSGKRCAVIFLKHHRMFIAVPELFEDFKSLILIGSLQRTDIFSPVNRHVHTGGLFEYVPGAVGFLRFSNINKVSLANLESWKASPDAIGGSFTRFHFWKPRPAFQSIHEIQQGFRPVRPRNIQRLRPSYQEVAKKVNELFEAYKGWAPALGTFFVSQAHAKGARYVEEHIVFRLHKKNSRRMLGRGHHASFAKCLLQLGCEPRPIVRAYKNKWLRVWKLPEQLGIR